MIVESVLSVPVKRFDYGTAPRQVDALVLYPDRVAALEVVTDPDQPFNRQQDALHRNKTIDIPGLRKSWIVLLSDQAKINNVKRALPALLLDWQDNPRPKRPTWDVKSSELVRLGIKPSELERLGIKPSELDLLGITSAEPIDDGTESGRVWLLPEHRRGWAGDERTVGEWVTRILVGKARDVPEKLAAHRDVAERHAFIWAIPSSDMGVQIQLEPGDDHPFPVTAPTLPAGVTHVWVAGHWRKGVLAWFPGRGWWRTPLSWSSEGPAT